MQIESSIHVASFVISLFAAWWVCSVCLRRDDVRTFKRVRLVISVLIGMLGVIVARSLKLNDYFSSERTLPDIDPRQIERLITTQPSGPTSQPAQESSLDQDAAHTNLR